MAKKFRATHIEKDCSQLSGMHDSELFFNCSFKDLRGLTLRNCVLNRSRFLTDTVEQAMGFTLTLDCASFANVEYSEVLFDLLLMLIIKTKGNTEKRRKLIEVLGRERVLELGRILESMEW